MMVVWAPRDEHPGGAHIEGDVVVAVSRHLSPNIRQRVRLVELSKRTLKQYVIIIIIIIIITLRRCDFVYYIVIIVTIIISPRDASAL
jgi:hypothetical protein